VSTAPNERTNPPDLRLALPNASEVEDFRRLFKKHFEVELSRKDALVVATHYLHMIQILTYEP
jgi:hypothetical protein